MSTNPLTPAQHFILAAAIEHTDGRIERFPDNIKGGARSKVLDGLFNRALITRDGDGWCVAAEGYDAMKHPRPGINSKRISAFASLRASVVSTANSFPSNVTRPLAPSVTVASTVTTVFARA